VEGSVQRIDIAYDTQGNPYFFTSYSDTGGSTIVNQVQRRFNGYGQLIQEWQAHGGAVNTSTTPSVQYGYGALGTGDTNTNQSRLTSITYPNGKVLTYNYASGLADAISRLSSLSDNSGTLESYSYLGLATVVKRSHPLPSPTPSLDLTYIGTGTGDAGDQYTGLDRFGRVVDQKWLVNTATPTVTDEFKYAYDRNSNVLYRTNEVNHNFDELYHANGSTNGYDNLNQLTAFARGTLNANHDTITTPSHSINYTLDAEGNFASTQTDGGSQVNNSFNKQNEETAAGANTLTFDANGNLTLDDQGHTLVYDAWNRLVTVKNGGTTLTSYKYDALGRRIVENPGTVHDLYYDAAWQVLEERWAGVSTATIQYVWSPAYVDALVLRDRSTQNNGTLDERLWVQQDANYNVAALINGSGTVVERYVYDPYGKQTVLDGSFNTRSSSSYGFTIGFQGLRLDTNSGLYYARSRDLSPTLGRWLEADPLRFGGRDTNLYRSDGNNSTGHVDPFGTINSIPGLTDAEYNLVQQFLKKEIDISKVPERVRRIAADFFERRAPTVKENARAFNIDRARALRTGKNPPGSLKEFNEALQKCKGARVTTGLKVGGALVLIAGMLYLTDRDGRHRPVPGAKMIRREEQAAVTVEVWELDDGSRVTVTIGKGDVAKVGPPRKRPPGGWPR
jgi:RHS repeat-associated protein